MPAKTLRKLKAAGALFVLLLLFAPCVAAQTTPRVKQNVTRAERAEWRALLAWPESCEESYRESYPEEEKYGGLVFHRLARGRYLVEVTCDGGGIQPSTIFMLYDVRQTRRARPLKLKGFEDETEVRALTKFDSATRELFLMSKADAMGACGLFVRYSFRAVRARVVEARRQDDCGRSDATPDTSRWPRVRLKE